MSNDMNSESDEPVRNADTQEIPLLSPEDEFEPEPDDDEGWQKAKPKFKSRELVSDESGDWLIYRSLIRRPVGSRFHRRNVYGVHEQRLELVDNTHVDASLALKFNFKPEEGESRIDVMRRKSWWMHGPKQIGIALLGLIGFVLTVAASTKSDVPSIVVFGFLLLAWICLGAWYYWTWMKWAYVYIVKTDQRYGYVYKPPFRLPGYDRIAALSNVSVVEAEDQSWFANGLGGLNPKWHYGIVSVDTPAQDDKWLKGVKFIPGHKEIAQMVISYQSESQEEQDAVEESRILQDETNREILKTSREILKFLKGWSSSNQE